MASFPLGAEVTLDELDRDPHPIHARLREQEPVSWLPALDGWLVTRHDLVLAAMRDDRRFTVDDPRFTTARVIGPSMLSLDGEAHARHRRPFTEPFRLGAVRERFAEPVAAEAERLVGQLAGGRGPAAPGRTELRREFAGPMAAAIVSLALGLGPEAVDDVLRWYEAIVTSVNGMSAGQEPSTAGRDAFANLSAHLQEVISGNGGDSLLAAAAGPASSVAGAAPLTPEQIVSDAAVLLFGGIETTEGMIANAALMLLERPQHAARAAEDPGVLEAAIEESLRLEPAAAVVDRYATEDVELGGARIGRGELVRISIAAANRDPALFPDPDHFALDRGRGRHLAFAQGPHVCVGVHLARLEARAALSALLRGLPDLRLDPQRRAEIRGLVFRKPPRLDVVWG
jgi:cytochrome P450